jgi:DNA-binding GntR family transcriptional regulator
MDLYEARAAIECEVVRLAAQRADADSLSQLETFLDETQLRYQPGTAPVELVKLDEEFHQRLAALSGNSELARLLDNMNGRLHYVRLVDLKALSRDGGHEMISIGAHRDILEAVKRKDVEAAQTRMRLHIERRLESITEIVRNAFADLYAP